MDLHAVLRAPYAREAGRCPCEERVTVCCQASEEASAVSWLGRQRPGWLPSL